MCSSMASGWVVCGGAKDAALQARAGCCPGTSRWTRKRALCWMYLACAGRGEGENDHKKGIDALCFAVCRLLSSNAHTSKQTQNPLNHKCALPPPKQQVAAAVVIPGQGALHHAQKQGSRQGKQKASKPPPPALAAHASLSLSLPWSTWQQRSSSSFYSVAWCSV